MPKKCVHSKATRVGQNDLLTLVFFGVARAEKSHQVKRSKFIEPNEKIKTSGERFSEPVING